MTHPKAEAQPQHKTTNIHQNKRIKVNPSSTPQFQKTSEIKSKLIG
jgi:nucleoid DNA-binding protein